MKLNKTSFIEILPSNLVQRSLLIFQNSVKSEETVKHYTWYLNKFKKFYKLKDYDSMVTIETRKIQEMIEDYVMEIKKTVNPNSVPSYVYPIKTFFEANDIDLKWRKIKKLFPAEIKKTGRSAYTTKDIGLMLDHTPHLRNQVIIHFLASTGCRIGALPELKIKHLTKMENCYAVLIYEDSLEEYTTFLTPEATQKLDAYLERRKADREYMDLESPIFRRKYRLGIEKVISMSVKSLSSVVLRALRNSGVRSNQLKKRGRYEKQTDHGFRKRFVTTLKSNVNVPVAYAERLAGHKVYTDELGNKITLDDSYLTPEMKKLFEVFSQAIPELTIDQTEQLRLKNVRQEEKITKLKRSETHVETLQTLVEDMKEKIENNDEKWSKMFEDMAKKFNDPKYIKNYKTKDNSN